MSKITIQHNGLIQSIFEADGDPIIEWLEDPSREIHCVHDNKGAQYFFKSHIAYVRIESTEQA